MFRMRSIRKSGRARWRRWLRGSPCPMSPRFPKQALGVTASHLCEQLIQKLIGKRPLGLTLPALGSFEQAMESGKHTKCHDVSVA